MAFWVWRNTHLLISAGTGILARITCAHVQRWKKAASHLTLDVFNVDN